MMLALLTAALSAAKSAASWAASFFSKPPGSYIGAAVLALILLWGVHHHGYGAGQTDCESAHAAKVEQAVRRRRQAAVAVVARSDVLTRQDAKTDRKAKEVIRYVAIQAKAQPDAGAECIPAALADRVRGLD
jgi:hypothetical protein